LPHTSGGGCTKSLTPAIKVKVYHKLEYTDADMDGFHFLDLQQTSIDPYGILPILITFLTILGGTVQNSFEISL
jgi:hypothetical protein